MGFYDESRRPLRKVNKIDLANKRRRFGQCPVAKGLQGYIMEARHDTVVTY